MIYALNAGPSRGWSSPSALIAAVLGVIGLAVLVPYERRINAPMLRLSLFGSRQFDAINVATVLLYGGWHMVAGMSVVALGLGLASFRAQPGSPYAAVRPTVLLWGLGTGLAVTPLTAAVLAAVSDSDLGEASAINDTAAHLGGVLAVAAVPILIGPAGGHGLAAALVHGFRPATLALAGLCVAAAIVTALFVSDARTGATRTPRIAPPAPHRGCALPDVQAPLVKLAREEA